jgi:hypothetical protein
MPINRPTQIAHREERIAVILMVDSSKHQKDKQLDQAASIYH